ncbi:hypothetical protein LSUE1_G000269 [Lachnellula suecica]|uniref:Uncharacterized protein n=1 Tax=Lachnellula suecica TaxID=602035 RepID=A0A8T9CEN3_9HELO|nr:hypothetical protein LSUE1_G000269 [Lachnellula suecica]
MFSLRTIAARRAPKALCMQCLKLSRPLSSRAIKTSHQRPTPFLPQTSFSAQLLSRNYASKTSADEIMEELQDQYATARDEFEIATEETEKKSLYGPDDRKAAREELEALKEMYEEALEGKDGEEVKRRIGQRIRELDNAVEALEQSALED